MKIMPQTHPKLNRLLAFFLLTLTVSCQSKVEQNPEEWAYLVTPQDKILVKLAISDAQQIKGLSGLRDEDWGDDDGLLFVNDEERLHEFWMPDTYFDLDLHYLDRDFKIIEIQRALPHFIGRYPEERIPRARKVWARHILEMKSKSAVSKRLKLGDRLEFQSPRPPQQIK